jgi:hypothetical protein
LRGLSRQALRCLDGLFLHLEVLLQSRRITAALLALTTAAALAACSDDDTDNPLSTGNDNTTVRFFNATSSSLALDIAENGTVESGNGNVAFGFASACTRVNDANPQLTVRPAGSTTNLAGFTPAFSAGGTYTVIVTGTQAAPVFTILNDQFTAPSAGNAAVRVVNATTSATAGTGNWDVYVNPPTSGTSTPAATVVGRNTATQYLTVPAGQTNSIRLTNAGQTAALQTIAVPGLTAGTVTTLVVTDAATPGGTPLQVFTLPPCAT